MAKDYYCPCLNKYSIQKILLQRHMEYTIFDKLKQEQVRGSSQLSLAHFSSISFACVICTYLRYGENAILINLGILSLLRHAIAYQIHQIPFMVSQIFIITRTGLGFMKKSGELLKSGTTDNLVIVSII